MFCSKTHPALSQVFPTERSPCTLTPGEEVQVQQGTELPLLQVGEGDLAPTFNVGGQFDGQNINPFVGAGASIDGQGGAGGLGGNVNTGVVFDGRGPNGANPTFGANAAVGNFNLGSLNGGRGFNFGRR